MAYRFLLEVPANLTADANVAVATAGDAQVLVERPAHGLGIDEPYVDLTVAAHTLGVVDAIYGWAHEIGATRPDSRLQMGIVLHDGRRIGLHDVDPRGLVAIIRRDQPWVERYVPKIGEHERDLLPPGAPSGTSTASGTATALASPSSTVRDVNLIDAEEEITIQGRTYAVIQVQDLAPAERVYHDLFGLDLIERMRQDADGSWVEMGPAYDHFTAAQENVEADIAFMGNGPLGVALSRAGRAARLDYTNILNELEVTMEPAAAAKLKAIVLLRGYTLLSAFGPNFSFRDPYGAIWDVRPVDQ